MTTQVEALQQIKALVVGDNRPNWAHEEARYAARAQIADICDLALAALATVSDAQPIGWIRPEVAETLKDQRTASDVEAVVLRKGRGTFHTLAIYEHPAPDVRPSLDLEGHRVMTREEYDALKLKGWHQVCHNMDSAGSTAIRYGSPDVRPSYMLEGDEQEWRRHEAEKGLLPSVPVSDEQIIDALAAAHIGWIDPDNPDGPAIKFYNDGDCDYEIRVARAVLMGVNAHPPSVPRDEQIKEAWNRLGFKTKFSKYLLVFARAILSAQPVSAQGVSEPLTEMWAIYYDNLGEQPYDSRYVTPWRLYCSQAEAESSVTGYTHAKHYTARKVFIYDRQPAAPVQKEPDDKATFDDTMDTVASARMKTWPERIYLQHGDDFEVPYYDECQEGSISWCADKIGHEDVEYVRADLAAPTVQAALSVPDAEMFKRLTEVAALLYSKWENGTTCYEDPDENGAYLGNAFRLDDAENELCIKTINEAENVCKQFAAPSAPSVSTSAEMETGWLVENGKQGDELRYRTMESGLPEWTADHNKAIRFARRIDAEWFAQEDEDAWAIVQHAWRDKVITVAPSVSADAKDGMPESQEPKYGIHDGRLFSRASGDFIPFDEPVFIFRARDRKAQFALSHYVSQCEDFEHQKAVLARMRHFADFERSHPDRMKEPDTAAIAAQSKEGGDK